jgi:hypothetical protein
MLQQVRPRHRNQYSHDKSSLSCKCAPYAYQGDSVDPGASALANALGIGTVRAPRHGHSVERRRQHPGVTKVLLGWHSVVLHVGACRAGHRVGYWRSQIDRCERVAVRTQARTDVVPLGAVCGDLAFTRVVVALLAPAVEKLGRRTDPLGGADRICAGGAGGPLTSTPPTTTCGRNIDATQRSSSAITHTWHGALTGYKLACVSW